MKLTLFSELEEKQKGLQTNQRMTLLENKRIILALEEFRKRWLAGGAWRYGRSFDFSIDNLGDITVSVYLSEKDTLKDFYIACDETIWQYKNMEWDTKRLTSNNHIDFSISDPVFSKYCYPTYMTLFLTHSVNCQMEIASEEEYRHKGTNKFYRVVCS